MILKIVLLIGLSTIHIFGNHLRFLQGLPRSIWLSIAGGASVAYVFVHLLPELSHARNELDYLNHPDTVYFIALLGLCFIYGLEKLAKDRSPESEGSTYGVHIFSYSFYNLLIGYLLINRPEEQGYVPLVLFFVAMGLHFLVDDYGLYEHHRKKYLASGRWLVSGAVLLGGIIAITTEISEVVVLTALAFLSGGLIMNVLKEELPEERKSKYWAFVLGVLLYSSLLFLLTRAAE